jgi:hypothetical protein
MYNIKVDLKFSAFPSINLADIQVLKPNYLPYDLRQISLLS